MGQNIVKNQHYVPRHYLRKWSYNDINNENAIVLLKDKNEITKTNVKNICQEKYFYKICDINKYEHELNNLIDYLYNYENNKNVNSLCKYFISLLKMNSSTEFDINAIEKIIGKIENDGIKTLQYKSLNDFKNININKALFYIIFQLLRTNTFKNNVNNSNYDEAYKTMYIENFPIILLFTSIKVIFNIICNYHKKITFIINKTNVSFITGDQPVIKLYENELYENEHINKHEVEYYYPLSPKYAIKLYALYNKKDSLNICNKYDFIEENINNNSIIENYNKQMYNNAYKFVISNNFDELNKFITS